MTTDSSGSKPLLLLADDAIEVASGGARPAPLQLGGDDSELGEQLSGFALAVPGCPLLSQPGFQPNKAGQHAELPARPVLGPVSEQGVPREETQMSRDTAGV